MSSPVEQIKSRLSIVDVVGSYIKLQKAGANLKAVCPFHHEKTPSFFVSPARESWHCFGCNKGGDIFSFVMEIEGLDFPGALKALADRAGIEIKKEKIEFSGEKTKTLSLLDDAKKFYQARLRENSNVINYLKDRGVKGETARDFSIGFAPAGWRNLYDYLKRKGYSDSEIEKSGMSIKSDKGYYDRFRSRIMFPLYNSSGQTVGFTGRTFGEENKNEGKYVNTPQTIVYDKSRILYAFDKAKTEIRKEDSCVMVEGNMDALMSYQAGVKNVVAVSGTAMTAEHLKIIKRLTNNLIMAFDKDEAGFKAFRRAVIMAMVEGFDVRAIEIPEGKDPADTIKENPEIWKKAVSGAKSIIDFYLDSLKEKTNDGKELNKKVRMEVVPLAAFIQNEIEKAHWVKKIAGFLGIKEEPIWEELKKASLEEFDNYKSLSQRQDEADTAERISGRLEMLKRRLTGVILWQKETDDQEIKNILQEAGEKIKTAEGETKDRQDLIFEADVFYGEVENLTEEIKKLISEMEKEEIKSQLENITEKIRRLESPPNGGDSADRQEEMSNLLNSFHDLTKKLNEFK